MMALGFATFLHGTVGGCCHLDYDGCLFLLDLDWSLDILHFLVSVV